MRLAERGGFKDFPLNSLLKAQIHQQTNTAK